MQQFTMLATDGLHLIICFIVGVFSLTLNAQAQRAFASFSNILYELLFTTKGPT